MYKDLSALSQEEVSQTRMTLSGLIDTLKSRKRIGVGAGGLIPDEDSVFSSLIHPERGDVLITIIRFKGGLEIFLSNRRDPTSPFVVMNKDRMKLFPGRRILNSSHPTLMENEYGLFLLSVQDQELLRDTKNRIDIFSVHFNVHDPFDNPHQEHDDLRAKPLELCSNSEKWKIYKQNREMDSRVPLIERELFSFKVLFARYNQGQKEEFILLTPEKFKQNLGQWIRDMYPYGIRLSLRKDFPDEHKKKLADVHSNLKKLLDLINARVAPVNGPEYAAYLKELQTILTSTLSSDPELSNFV